MVSLLLQHIFLPDSSAKDVQGKMEERPGVTSGPPDCLAPSILATPVAADFSKTESSRCEEGISYRRDRGFRVNWMILPKLCWFCGCEKSGGSSTLAFGLSGVCLIGFLSQAYCVNIHLLHEFHQPFPEPSASILNPFTGPWTCTASSGRKSPAWTIALRGVTASMVVCTSPTGWMVVVTCRRGQLGRLSELSDVWNPVGWKIFSSVLAFGTCVVDRYVLVRVLFQHLSLTKSCLTGGTRLVEQCAQDGKASKKGTPHSVESSLHWRSDLKTPKV